MHVIVIGAGIVGLATAIAVRDRLDADVTVIDKEASVAAHQSGRNSGVVHSGVYYRPGTAKADLVARGREQLRRWCVEHGVTHETCGKVIVATNRAQLPQLLALEERGHQTGLRVRRLDPVALADVEPWVRGLSALHIPEAAVVDFVAVCQGLASDLAASRRGELVLGETVSEIGEQAGGVVVTTDRGEHRADGFVVCAGLQSDLLARSAGIATGVSILPFRGEYHALRPERDYLVRHLIYPVPDPAFPFLGVHLTRGFDGHVHVGPNAVAALGREAYSWRASSPGGTWELLRRRSSWHLGRRHWAAALGEVHRSLSRSALLAAVRELVPAVGPHDLVRAPAGIRAQAIDRSGRLLDDFAFADTRRGVFVLNAPSPAATASFAIAEHITDRLATHLP